MPSAEIHSQSFTNDSATQKTFFAESSDLRILVVIASYGRGNDRFLSQIIEEYRSMPFAVRIVVLSNIEKNLGAGIEVIVGLPSKNPRSLPFAHKKVFADRREHYDLFIYTEDDILTTEANIRFFLKSCTVLQDDELGGFMRIEKAPDGQIFFPDVHNHFHWELDSIRQRGDLTYAFFTNEHAAMYMLTRAHLERALRSGNFLDGPREGKYQMLETAATDIYTQCGLRKMIAISHLDNIVVSHLPNKYIGKMGLSANAFRRQIGVLTSCNGEATHGPQLFPTDTKCPIVPFSIYYSKSYYEPAREDVLSLVPPDCGTLLSIGCGWGAAEEELSKRGISVTAVPLDSVISASIQTRNINVVSDNFGEFIRKTESTFDCVLISNILHLVPNPTELLLQISSCLRERGTAIAVVPSRIKLNALWKFLRAGILHRIISYQECGVHFVSPSIMRSWFKRAGIRVDSTINIVGPEAIKLSRLTFSIVNRWLASEFILVGRKLTKS